MKTILIGALGLFVAAGLGFLSLQLVSQPVGLSSEPLSAGNQLVPTATTAKPKATRKKKQQSQPAAPAPVQSAPSTPAPVASQPAVVDDHGGGSGHSGKGRGGGSDD